EVLPHARPLRHIAHAEDGLHRTVVAGQPPTILCEQVIPVLRRQGGTDACFQLFHQRRAGSRLPPAVFDSHQISVLPFMMLTPPACRTALCRSNGTSCIVRPSW